MAKVLAAIVSYESAALTERCYASLLKQTMPVDVVIWDNASSPSTTATLSKLSLRASDKLVLSPDNLHWAGGVNASFDVGGDDYDYLVMLNNDVELTPDTIEALEQVARRGDVGSVGPHMTRPNVFPDYPEPYEVRWLFGACVMLRSGTWKAIGGLDPELRLAGDDADYAIRQKEAGLKLYVTPTVVIEHSHHASSKSPEWATWEEPSWSAFREKWHGYFVNADEERNCLWNWREPFVGWRRGTGWMTPRRRAEIWRLEGRPGEPPDQS